MPIKTETILLIGAGAAAVYFLTRPRSPQVVMGYNAAGQPIYTQSGTGQLPTSVYNPNIIRQPDPLAQQIAAGGSVLQGLGDILGNFFGTGS